MSPSARLGGFKVLKDVVRISLVLPNNEKYSPAEICRAMADQEINLPYVTCLYSGRLWGLNMVIESINGRNASRVLGDSFGRAVIQNTNSVVLSIFPHKNNPEITGTLFDAFGQEGVKPDALANSPSAISVVLKETFLNKASSALFEPFSFSAYRTPADWKLAQKGKEQLYKEVVASYQEKRPKVYGLEYQEGLEFVRTELNSLDIGPFGASFKEFARQGYNLSFLATSPGPEKGKQVLAFCLPMSTDRSYIPIIKRIAPETNVNTTQPVTVFSMNGPHFGDRYGIASELLSSFEKNKIDLLGLSCTIASIIGVLPSHQLESAVQAVQQCFEVPSVIKKEPFHLPGRIVPPN
jgi:aspartokinase